LQYNKCVIEHFNYLMSVREFLYVAFTLLWVRRSSVICRFTSLTLWVALVTFVVRSAISMNMNMIFIQFNVVQYTRHEFNCKVHVRYEIFFTFFAVVVHNKCHLWRRDQKQWPGEKS